DKSRSEEIPEEVANRDRGSLESTNSPSTVNNDGFLGSPITMSRNNGRRMSRQETTTSPPTSADGSLDPAASSQNGGDTFEKLPSIPQGAEGGSLSLEQSVRTFRLFEILRSG